MRGGSSRPHPGGVGNHDFSAMVHSSFGHFPEHQLVVLDLREMMAKSQEDGRPGAQSALAVLVTMMFPPPGVWLTLDREPTLA